MFADTLLKKALGDDPSGITPTEAEQMFVLMEKHPDLFMTMADVFKKKVAAGKARDEAARETVKEHEARLRILSV